jgi:hypothetical protein
MALLKIPGWKSETKCDDKLEAHKSGEEMQKRWAQGNIKLCTLIAALSLLLLSTTIPLLGAAGPAVASTTAAASGDAPLSERFGVSATHLSFSEPAVMAEEFRIMSETGIKWIRTEFAWVDMESAPGVWNFDDWDRIVSLAAQYDINILGLLMSAPTWANGGNTWNYAPTDMDAWRNYVSVVTTRYRGMVPAWEIWNEPNIPMFWMPQPDPTDYVTLLQASTAVIRTTDPQATIVMGGMAGLGADFLDASFQQGAADYVDAVAYHPYAQTLSQDNPNPQEDLSRYLVEFLKAGIAQYTNKPLEIWITEIGWTTATNTPVGVDQQTQANYMLRSFQNYAGTDVDKVFYFSLEDPQQNPPDSDNYYGLMDKDLAPKTSLSFYRNFESLLGGATSASSDVVEAASGDSSTLEIHSFRLPDGGLVVGAWKADDGADVLDLTVRDPSLDAPVTVDPATGQSHPTVGTGRDAHGNITVSDIAIGKNPVLLKMGVKPAGSLTSWYFAEGYTGDGFQEFLSLGNSRSVAASAKIVYMFPDGTSQEQYVTVEPKSRATIDVNKAVGPGKEVSAEVQAATGIVVERPMYFKYQGKWTGGHDVVGANYPSQNWYFAEGYTGDGFDEWVCVLNPGDAQAALTFNFQTPEGEQKVVTGYTVPAHSRASFKINDLLGQGFQNSLRLTSDQPVVAERSMYFDYRGMGGNNWEAGHAVMGTSALSRQYLFAEGTTREGFEEWLTIQNPNPSPISVTADYQLGPDQGEPVQKEYQLGAFTRTTIFVANEVGTGKDVSVRLTSSSPFLAERPMYFRYWYGGADWTGGHVVVGSSAPSADWFFAEGYTGAGFHEWISLQNPADADSNVRVTFYSSGSATVTRDLVVPARSRITVLVNDQVGQDKQVATELQVISGPPIVAERPMYFSYGDWDGGHNVLGYSSSL